jgi:hypothetical protein
MRDIYAVRTIMRYSGPEYCMARVGGLEGIEACELPPGQKNRMFNLFLFQVKLGPGVSQGIVQ